MFRQRQIAKIIPSNYKNDRNNHLWGEFALISNICLKGHYCVHLLLGPLCQHPHQSKYLYQWKHEKGVRRTLVLVMMDEQFPHTVGAAHICLHLVVTTISISIYRTQEMAWKRVNSQGFGHGEMGPRCKPTWSLSTPSLPLTDIFLYFPAECYQKRYARLCNKTEEPKANICSVKEWVQI